MISLIPRQDKNTIGLIGHAIIGYPNLATTKELVKILVAEGADLIELQIPFSEPIADGPVFTKANFKALAEGITLDTCLDFMHEMSELYPIPFVFMTYANIVFVRGFASFVTAAKESGAKGAIIPDLPSELATDYLRASQQNDFAAIQIIPPNITEERLSELCDVAEGFVYAVSRKGVTGPQTQLGQATIDLIEKIRANTELPIAVGFGISSKDDINFLKPYADYAVVGTQTLRIYAEKGLAGVADFWRQLRAE